VVQLRRGVLDTTLCDKVCQRLGTCQWSSPVSSTNKTDRHNIAEILLKEVFNTITLTLISWAILKYSWFDESVINHHNPNPRFYYEIDNNLVFAW